MSGRGARPRAAHHDDTLAQDIVMRCCAEWAGGQRLAARERQDHPELDGGRQSEPALEGPGREAVEAGDSLTYLGRERGAFSECQQVDGDRRGVGRANGEVNISMAARRAYHEDPIRKGRCAAHQSGSADGSRPARAVVVQHPRREKPRDSGAALAYDPPCPLARRQRRCQRSTTELRRLGDGRFQRSQLLGIARHLRPSRSAGRGSAAHEGAAVLVDGCRAGF